MAMVFCHFGRVFRRFWIMFSATVSVKLVVVMADMKFCFVSLRFLPVRVRASSSLSSGMSKAVEMRS